MRRGVAFAAVTFGALMTITPPAHAKFNVRVVIDGPGLPRSIELLNPVIDIGCVFNRPCSPASAPPAGPLGPRYTVIQFLEGHHARGPMMDRIVHDLYPDATGGPRLFTASGQAYHEWDRMRRVRGGWTRAPQPLITTLRARGLPAQPPIERLANLATATAGGQEIERGSNGAAIGISAVLLIGAAALGLPWRRRRRRPSGA
jgi:hypothetical protein